VISESVSKDVSKCALSARFNGDAVTSTWFSIEIGGEFY